MKRIWGLILATLITCPAYAEHDGPFGAIGYSEAHRNSYAQTDFPTRAAAEAAVLADCHKDDPADTTCQAPLWFRNACGAIAKASDGIYGTGWGDTQDIASNWAVRTCRKEGGTDCRMRMVVCSPGGAMTMQ